MRPVIIDTDINENFYWERLNINQNCAGDGTGSSDHNTSTESASLCADACADYFFFGWWSEKSWCRCYDVCNSPTTITNLNNANVVYQKLPGNKHVF